MNVLRAFYKSFFIQSITAITVIGLFSSCQSKESAKSDALPDKAAQTKDAPQSGPVASTVSETAAEASQAKQTQKLVVYYFHTTARCYSCNMIENFTKQAIETGFSDHLKKGLIEFKSVNIDQEDTKHFIEDYKLYTKSVIISEIKDGKEANWKNLEQVWTLLRDQAKFSEYIKTEVKSYL